MTATIYERGAVRESIIWNPFQYNGPFNTPQEVERAIVFGLYANTYLHGHNYLNEIETEDLAKLVDNYTVAIAQIDNEGARLALEVTAKRYVERIEKQIHDANMVTREQKIDALNDEYDARTDALEADEAAITTKQAEVQLAWDRATQKIKDLEMKTELEDVAQQMVDVDITEQELRAARADLAVIEAGLKGLDIQLAITQAGIDQTNTDLQITEAGNEVDEIEIRVSETEVQESNVDLDITNAGIALSKAEAEGEKIQADTKGVGVQTAEAGIQIVEAGARQSQYDAEIAKIKADTARLGLVDSEHTLAISDKKIAQAENELLVQEKYLLDAQGDNIKTETGFLEDQKDEQETLDDKIKEHDQSEHDFDIEMSQKETEFKDGISEKKVDMLEGDKKDLVDDIRDRKFDDAKEKVKIAETRWEAQEKFKDAAIEAAQMIADANLVTTLTHSVGEGEPETPEQQTWTTISSI